MSICYFIDTSFTGYFVVSQNERLLIPPGAIGQQRDKDILKRSAVNLDGGEHPPNTSYHATAAQSPAGYFHEPIYIVVGYW